MELKKMMVLKIKEFKNSKFYERCSADLFNDDEMKKLNDITAAAIKCGCDVKVEYKEMEF